MTAAIILVLFLVAAFAFGAWRLGVLPGRYRRPLPVVSLPVSVAGDRLDVGDARCRAQVLNAVTIASLPCDPRAPGAWIEWP